jgi:hypothetical protein
MKKLRKKELVIGLTIKVTLTFMMRVDLITRDNMKFNIQDRIVLDEMVDTFTAEMHKNQDDAELMDKRPIITREYWLAMIEEVQRKLDDFTTKKALSHSKRYR